MRHDKKPYQARMLLKSIRYWQAVVAGEQPAKRRMAYYVNKLKWHGEGDIEYLERVAKMEMVKKGKYWIIKEQVK